MKETKIKLTDNTFDVVAKISDGNPGAMMVLMELLNSTADKDSLLGGMGAILSLDTHGIYGTDIYVLNNDICEGNITKTIAVLRSVQLGFFSSVILKDACGRQDHSGKEMIPVDELYEKVKKQLPNFDK